MEVLITVVGEFAAFFMLYIFNSYIDKCFEFKIYAFIVKDTWKIREITCVNTDDLLIFAFISGGLFLA